MSKQANEISTEQTQSGVPRSSKNALAVIWMLIVTILFVAAFCYGYFQLAHVNMSLAGMVSDARHQAESAERNVVALQQTVAVLQQEQQKSQELSAKQEQMMSEWQTAQKGDLDKWYAAEAFYLVKLANDYLQFNHDVGMAAALLQRADRALANSQDANLVEIRKSLAGDIASAQALPQPDITKLYLQLVGLSNQIDQLPLPETPLQPDNAQTAAPNTAANTSWWQAGLARSWQMLSKIVIVRQFGPNAKPLVLPEEKQFLYQNLHAEMQNAMWGVLNRRAEVYKESLAQASAWIQKYFNQNVPVTKSVLENLQALQSVDVQPAVLNLSTTTQLFQQYFEKIGQAKAM